MYSNSNKIYHFAAVCLSRPKKESVCQLQTGHAEYSDVESNYDDLNVLVLTLELQTNAVTDQQYPRKLFATLVLGEKRVEFQIDRGVTCNIITHYASLTNVWANANFKQLLEFSQCTTSLQRCPQAAVQLQ